MSRSTDRNHFPFFASLCIVLGAWLLFGMSAYAQSENSSGKILRLGQAEQTLRTDAGSYSEYLLQPITRSFDHAAQSGDWQIPARGIVSLGHKDQGGWIRFRVMSQTQTADAWLLTLAVPTLEWVEMRLFDPLRGAWSRSQISGNAVSSQEKPIWSRYPTFELDLPAGEERVIYIRASSFDYLNLPAVVVRRDAWHQQESQLIPLLGAFFGAMFAMLIYNGSLLIFTRDKAYLWYCLYLSCSITYTLNMTGLGNQYLWGDIPSLASRLLPMSICASFAAAGVFIRSFLDLKQRGGYLLQISNFTILYWFVVTVIVAFKPELFTQLWVYEAGFFSCVVAQGTAMRLWYEGNVSARYFTIAWLALYMSTGYLTLALAGFIPMSHNPIHLQLIGFTLEFLLLSIALAERINRERIARIQAQREALAASQALGIERLTSLRTQQEANVQLEHRVQDRTRALEESNQALAAANALLSELSQRDALTGLFNRRHFDELFVTAVKQAAIDRHSIGIAMLDIDHFKRINDSYGHTAGDHCIVAVADVLRRYTQRSGESAARFGGEEFILLFTNVSQAALYTLCERIRHDIESMLVSVDGSGISFTVSIGAACLQPQPGDQREAFSKQADQALYSAKAEGRNRVCVFTASNM